MEVNICRQLDLDSKLKRLRDEIII